MRSVSLKTIEILSNQLFINPGSTLVVSKEKRSHGLLFVFNLFPDILRLPILNHSPMLTYFPRNTQSPCLGGVRMICSTRKWTSMRNYPISFLCTTHHLHKNKAAFLDSSWLFSRFRSLRKVPSQLMTQQFLPHHQQSSTGEKIALFCQILNIYSLTIIVLFFFHLCEGFGISSFSD